MRKRKVPPCMPVMLIYGISNLAEDTTSMLDEYYMSDWTEGSGSDLKIIVPKNKTDAFKVNLFEDTSKPNKIFTTNPMCDASQKKGMIDLNLDTLAQMQTTEDLKFLIGLNPMKPLDERDDITRDSRDSFILNSDSLNPDFKIDNYTYKQWYQMHPKQKGPILTNIKRNIIKKIIELSNRYKTEALELLTSHPILISIDCLEKFENADAKYESLFEPAQQAPQTSKASILPIRTTNDGGVQYI